MKPRYAQAIFCYLAIPVVVIACGAAASLINPEWAARTANYATNFKLLQLTKAGVFMAGAGLALILWFISCYLVLRSRGRSMGWLALAFAGPPGFCVITALKDRAPGPEDRYQAAIGRLNTLARSAYEIAFFVAVWVLAYGAIVIKRALTVRLQSAMTGRSVDDIVAEQLASSGMWAAGEAIETMFLAPLLYLLWPVAFNAMASLYRRHS